MSAANAGDMFAGLSVATPSPAFEPPTVPPRPASDFAHPRERFGFGKSIQRARRLPRAAAPRAGAARRAEHAEEQEHAAARRRLRRRRAAGRVRLRRRRRRGRRNRRRRESRGEDERKPSAGPARARARPDAPAPPLDRATPTTGTLDERADPVASGPPASGRGVFFFARVSAARAEGSAIGYGRFEDEDEGRTDRREAGGGWSFPPTREAEATGDAEAEPTEAQDQGEEEEEEEEEGGRFRSFGGWTLLVGCFGGWTLVGRRRGRRFFSRDARAGLPAGARRSRNDRGTTSAGNGRRRRPPRRFLRLFRRVSSRVLRRRVRRASLGRLRAPRPRARNDPARNVGGSAGGFAAALVAADDFEAADETASTTIPARARERDDAREAFEASDRAWAASDAAYRDAADALADALAEAEGSAGDSAREGVEARGDAAAGIGIGPGGGRREGARR